jgi:ATP-binding cassette, subfamily B, bacterial
LSTFCRCSAANSSEASGSVCASRARSSNPPILILDEATSAVDNETEEAIQRSLHRISVGRTTVIIAHRLSTVRHAACIYVMTAKGEVLESGRHKELIARNGFYASLWRVQTGNVEAAEPGAESALELRRGKGKPPKQRPVS